MSEKRIVSRSAAIALGIVCIILVVGVVGAFAYYVPMINDKDNTISSLNSQISSYYAQNRDLRDQVSDLNEIVNLRKVNQWRNSSDWLSQPAGAYTSWNFSATYAGVIGVLAQSSAGNNAYVRVIWNSDKGVTYDNTIGNSSVALWGCQFPVLPSSNVEIRVGNTNSVNGATIYVLINHWY